jgi:hypothetical protein
MLLLLLLRQLTGEGAAGEGDCRGGRVESLAKGPEGLETQK